MPTGNVGATVTPTGPPSMQSEIAAVLDSMSQSQLYEILVQVKVLSFFNKTELDRD